MGAQSDAAMDDIIASLLGHSWCALGCLKNWVLQVVFVQQAWQMILVQNGTNRPLALLLIPANFGQSRVMGAQSDATVDDAIASLLGEAQLVCHGSPEEPGPQGCLRALSMADDIGPKQILRLLLLLLFPTDSGLEEHEAMYLAYLHAVAQELPG